MAAEQDPYTYQPGSYTLDHSTYYGHFDSGLSQPYDLEVEWGPAVQLRFWQAWRVGHGEALLPLLEMWKTLTRPFLSHQKDLPFNIRDFNDWVLSKIFEDLTRYKPEKNDSVLQWLRVCTGFHWRMFFRQWARGEKLDLALYQYFKESESNPDPSEILAAVQAVQNRNYVDRGVIEGSDVWAAFA